MKFPTYIVGGWVRDKIQSADANPKDIDLCMVAPSYEAMREAVLEAGGEIFVENPEYFTIRCHMGELGAVDVALARFDGDYADGRRPDSVEIATDIVQDLGRRDFTCNAIAISLEDGLIVDPFDGLGDILSGQLKSVGDAKKRFSEDYLRIFRALRFAITKCFTMSSEIDACLRDKELCAGLKNISKERIRDELHKCFEHSTFVSVRYFNEYPNLLYWAVEAGVRLQPTLKK